MKGFVCVPNYLYTQSKKELIDRIENLLTSGLYFFSNLEEMVFTYELLLHSMHIFQIEVDKLSPKDELFFEVKGVHIVKEWSLEETYEYMEENEDRIAEKAKEPHERCWLAEHGFGLKQLVNAPEDYVREVVARYGYELETLIHDKNPRVKKTAQFKLGERDLLEAIKKLPF